MVNCYFITTARTVQAMLAYSHFSSDSKALLIFLKIFLLILNFQKTYKHKLANIKGHKHITIYCSHRDRSEQKYCPNKWKCTLDQELQIRTQHASGHPADAVLHKQRVDLMAAILKV